MECVRSLRIDAFRGVSEIEKGDVTTREVVGGGRTDRSDPVDNPRTVRRHDHVVGVKVGMASPSARGRRSIKVRTRVAMCSGMPLGTRDAAANQPRRGWYFRRWGRLMNRHVEARKDRARLPASHCPCLQALPPGSVRRSVSARCRSGLPKSPRRSPPARVSRQQRLAAGHSCLVLAEPPWDADLE